MMRFDGLTPGMKPNPLKARQRPAASPLTEASFSPNPGNLRMFQYIPRGLKAAAPLVVVLHGCGQTAAAFGLETGWSALADELGFALLAPEQKAVNNPNTCFNWFNPEDIQHGLGEAASIAAMIQTVVETHKLDARRVFITGLSAGGAMTAVMLANYPDLFAGGAIVAGLPFGAAHNVRDALEIMRSAPLHTPHVWGDMVRHATTHKGHWPKVSIWHGALDATVNINNAQASAAQWADLHGLKVTDARQEMVDGAIHLSWGHQLEVWTLPLMGHGAPIDSRDIGQPSAFVLETGISSARHIAGFWGLAGAATARAPSDTPPKPSKVTPLAMPKIEAVLQKATAAPVAAPRREHVILKALRAAGLVKR